MGRSLHDDSLRPAQGHEEARERLPQQSHRDSRAQDGRTAYHLRGYSYRLNSSQSAMLQDVGAFRTITAESLRNHVYRGNEEQFRKDLRNLTDQRLVTVQPAPAAREFSLHRAWRAAASNFHRRTSGSMSGFATCLASQTLLTH